MKSLFLNGIQSQVHYIPLFYQPFYKSDCAHNLPGSVDYYEKSLSIPLFPSMNKNDVDFVVDNIKHLMNSEN